MANIKKTEDSRSDFAQGTLSGVTATNEGSLELSFVTTKIDKVETTSADFNEGTLTKLKITSNGDLQLGLDGSDVSHTENFLEGSLSGAKLAAGDITLRKGVNVSYSEAFDGILTDVEIKDGQLTLQPSGVQTEYNETSKADFETGILSNVVASLIGDLELARDAETSVTETTDADFNTGTLVNAHVEAGSISADYSSTTFDYSDVAGAQQLVRNNYSMNQTETFSTGTLNGVEVVGTELKLGKDTSKFTHQEDFKTGVLDNTTATDNLQLDGGDLILKNETVEQAYQDSTQAQFAEGILDRTEATVDGSLQLGVSPVGSSATLNLEDDFTTGTFDATELGGSGGLQLGYTPSGGPLIGSYTTEAIPASIPDTTDYGVRRIIQVGGYRYYLSYSSTATKSYLRKVDSEGNVIQTHDLTAITGATNVKSVAYDGTNFWVVVASGQHVYKLSQDLTSIEIDATIGNINGRTTFDLGDITFDGKGSFWIPVSESSGSYNDYIAKYDIPTASGPITPTFYFSSNYRSIWGLAYFNGKIYASNYNTGDRIYVYNEDGTVATYITEPSDDTRTGMSVVDHKLYLENNGDRLFEVYDLPVAMATTGTHTATIATFEMGTVESSTITWNETVAAGDSISVEVSTDGTSWMLVENGGIILSEGTDLSGKSIQVRETLTRAGATTPVLKDVAIMLTYNKGGKGITVNYTDAFDGTLTDTVVNGGELSLTQTTAIGAVTEEVGGNNDTNGGTYSTAFSIVKVTKNVKLLGAEQYIKTNSSRAAKIVVLDAGTTQPGNAATSAVNVAQATITGSMTTGGVANWFGNASGLNYTLQAGHYYFIGIYVNGALDTQYRGGNFGITFDGDWGEYVGGLYMNSSSYYNYGVGQTVPGSYGSTFAAKHGLRLYVEAETTVTATSGDHVSKPISVGGKVKTSSISWTINAPTGTAGFVDISTDNGATWTEVTNGGALFSEGTVVDGDIVLRERLIGDGSATPKISNVSLTVETYDLFAASGTRIRTLTLDNIDQVTVNWVENKPAGTDIVIETSLDGMTYYPVVNGGFVQNFPINTDGTLYIKQTLSTTDSYVTPKLDELNITTSATGYLASGSRTSPVITVPTDLVSNARITWTETKPEGTTITIQVSTDGGTIWNTVSNGGTITGFTVGANAPLSLMIKQLLYTNNPDVTPMVHDMTVTVDEYKYKASGTRVSVAKDLSSLRILTATTLTVGKTTPIGTSVKVETSLDNVNWTEVTNTLGLTAGINLTGKSLYVRETLATTDVYKTPTLSNVSYHLEGYEYTTSKAYTSTSFTVENKGVADSAIVSWAETAPAGTSVKVYLVLPNNTKVQVTNGANVAQIAGQLLENATMRFEADLSTTNIANTPTLSSIRINGIGKRYDKTAVRTAPVRALDITSVASSQIVWNANATVGTLLVETSLDGGVTWQPATNGGGISGIAKGDNVADKELLVRTTLTGGITGTPKLNDISWSVSGGFLPSGSRESQAISLADVGIVKNSYISWNKTEPAGTSARVQIRVSTNGGVSYGDWTEPVNGSYIPGIVEGMDASDVLIQIKQNLSTNDVSVTPQIHDLSFSVESGFKGTGTYVSNFIPVGQVEVVADSLVDFVKNAPAETNAVVEIRISDDNGVTWGNWLVASDNAAIPSIVSGANVAAKAIQIRMTLSTTDVSVSPTFSSLGFTMNAGYQTGGTYLSKVVDKSGVGITSGSQISWVATAPLGTNIVAETSVDGGITWQTATNGGAIPNVDSGDTIQVRFTLNTADLTKTPNIDSLWYNISSGYAIEGVRTSPVYTFLGAGKVSTSRIKWTADTPIGTNVIIETSIDNGLTWQIATNGYIIPGIMGGSQVNDRGIMVRQTLKTNNTDITPVLHDLTLTIEGGGFKQTGYRISPAIALDTVGTVSGNTISWISTEPSGTTIEVQAAITGNSTTIPAPEQFRPLIIESKTQMGENRYECFGRVEQIVNETDMSGLYLWIKEILTTEDVN